MRIRTSALLMMLMALPLLAQAADVAKSSSAAATAAKERSTMFKKASSGTNITSNKQQYQLLTGVRAADIKQDESPQQTLTRMGGGKLLETKGNSFIVFSAGQASAASVTSVNGTSYPTAYNARTGGIGIVTGTMNVKLKNAGDAAAIATDHGLEVVRVFAHLQTAFYRAKPGQDVVVVATKLSADTRVASAEVEVLEHVNMPN